MNTRFSEFKESLFRKPFAKRLILMLMAVMIMGIGVSVLNLTRFGVDPFSAVCYGLSNITGISFGTTELLVHGIMFLLVISSDVKQLGFGTLGNMVLVGYTADLTTYILKKCGISYIDSFATRVLLLIIMLSIFVVAAAVYMNSGLGSSPYDALPNVIHQKLEEKTGKKIKFRYVRMVFDGLFTLTGFLIGGPSGVMTVILVVSLGPAIEAVAKVLAKIFKLDEQS